MAEAFQPAFIDALTRQRYFVKKVAAACFQLQQELYDNGIRFRRHFGAAAMYLRASLHALPQYHRNAGRVSGGIQS